MSGHGRATCPECGTDKVTTIVVPRPAAEVEPGKPATQRAWRCLQCDAQWHQGTTVPRPRETGDGGSTRA